MTDKIVPAPIKAAIDSILAKEDILHQNKTSIFKKAFKIQEEKLKKEESKKLQIDKNIADLQNLKNKMLAENFKSKDKGSAFDKLFKISEAITNPDQIKLQEPKRNLRSSQTSDKNSKKSDTPISTKQKKDIKTSQTRDSKIIDNDKKQMQKDGKTLSKIDKNTVKKTSETPIEEQKTRETQKNNNPMKAKQQLKINEDKFAQLFVKTSNEQSKQKPVQIKKQQSITQKNLKGLPNYMNLYAQMVTDMREKKKIQDFIASKNYILEGENELRTPQEKKTSDQEGSLEQNRKDLQLLNQFIYENDRHIFTVTRGKIPNKTQKFIDIEIHPIGMMGERRNERIETMQTEASQKESNNPEKIIDFEEEYVVYERKRANADFMMGEGHKGQTADHNSNSCVYTYFRCTIVNSKLPHCVRKYCSNISILYSKMQKYKTSLRLLETIKKVEFSFIDHNYDGRYKFNGDYDRDQDQIIKLRLPAQNFRIIQRPNPLENSNNDEQFVFLSPLLKGNEQSNKKRTQLLQKELKLLRTVVNQLKTDKQRLATMYERQKQTKQNLYNELLAYREKVPTSVLSPMLQIGVKQQQAQPSSEQLPSLQSTGPGSGSVLFQLETLRQKQANSLVVQSKQPLVQILEIDDDSAQMVMQDVESYNRSSSGSDSYYKEAKDRDFKDSLRERGFDETKPHKGRPRRQKAIVPQIPVFEHQTHEPGKFVHAINGRMFSTNQILAFNGQSHKGQQYMSSARHISAVNNNNSFYTNRGSGRQRTFRSSGGPNALNERKLSWQQWAKRTENEVIKAIVQEESEFTECKRFIKSSEKLVTMGFMQLFHGVLQLFLSDNKIQKIEGLFNMKKLRMLELNNNLIERIEELDENRELKQIFLRDNKITKIQNVFHLRKLEVLSLASNQLTVIPEQIGELMSLRAFYINKNNLEKLSDGLLNLKSLKMFRISDNPRLNLNEFKNKQILEELEKKGKVSVREGFN